MSKPTRRNFLKAAGLTVGCATMGGVVGTVIAAPNSIDSSPKSDEYLEQKTEMYRQLYSGGSTPEDVINDAIAVAEPQMLVQPDYTMNEGDAFIPEIWARQGLAILKENMVAGNLVHRDFSNQIATATS